MDRPATSLKPNILIAPLDWGLGHATRCIPLIRQLIQKNCKVLIASEGRIKCLLEKEFPQLSFLPLKGYRIHYSKNHWTLPLHIGIQIPKILSTIQYENERVREIVEEHNIHGIISDNRYGFYHKTIPSIFITHQLRIKTPFGKIADNFLQKLNYRYINRFTQCWVPDHESPVNFAGELSHPQKKPSLPLSYVGPLSRLHKLEEKENYLLILLSGPEPQRTIFESILMEELKDFTGPVVLVRGLPGEAKQLKLPSNISVHNHLPSEELNQKLNEASLVISRCGYSTVMDLAVLKKKSILIPTPGQTEQEYLARHLMKNNLALCIDQKKFRLKTALDLSLHFNYQFENFPAENYLDKATDDFIALVKSSIR
jgi:uncharacterized protein (TIGR00661 family)